MTNNGLPVWADTLVRKYRAGISHCFILHFNIDDYVPSEDGYYTLLDFLQKVFEQRKMIILYNISAGIQFLKGSEEEFRKMAGVKKEAQGPLASLTGAIPQGLPRNASSAFPLFEKILVKAEVDNKVALIIDYAEMVVPADSGSTASAEDRANVVTLQRWAKDSKIREAGNFVILLTANLVDLHPALRLPDSGFEEVLIEKPGIEERERYIRHLAKDYQEEMVDLSPQQFAYITAGLSRTQIEDIFLKARECWGKLSLKLVKERKYEILEKQHKGQGLQFVEPIYGWETVGGLKHIKDKLLKVLAAMEAGDWRRVPMGILFTGPPGTGKSHVAQVIAKELGFNFVELGKVKSKWVGESERNLAKVLLSVKANVPIIWFIDEIDQILGRRDEVSTDSGVNRALFGDFLKFMSDPTNRGRVLIIGATNRPDLMDPAMKRPGRFDLRIPFLFPTPEERADIFTAMMEKYQYRCSINNFTAFAQSPFQNIWAEPVEVNGADIEVIVNNAYGFSVEAGREEIQEEDLSQGIKEHIPSYDKEMVDYMTLVAIKECSSRSLLPPNFEGVLRTLQKRQAGEAEFKPTPSSRRVRNNYN